VDTPGDSNCVAWVRDVIEQNGKFIASHSGDTPVPSHAGFQPVANLNDQVIAGSMTHAIVHYLEIIDIQKKNRSHLLLVSLCPIHHSLQPVQEENTIGQPGQLVVTRVE
jgi:hypothetical protein